MQLPLRTYLPKYMFRAFLAASFLLDPWHLAQCQAPSVEPWSVFLD